MQLFVSNLVMAIMITMSFTACSSNSGNSDAGSNNTTEKTNTEDNNTTENNNTGGGGENTGDENNNTGGGSNTGNENNNTGGGANNNAPVFTSTATPNVQESSLSAVILVARDDDNDTITYSISGTDASLFDVDSSTGEVTFKTAPDFEQPSDANADNVYTFTAVASDAKESTEQTLSITVTDRENKVLQTAKALASDAAEDDRFGFSVAIDGDYIVVGARKDDDAGTDSGSAYVFKRNSDGSLSELAKLTASDGASGDNFGSTVAIDGDYIIVSAPNDDDAGSNSGSAYVFKRNSDVSFTELAKLMASDEASEDIFGFSVDISGDYIIIGAFKNDDAGSASGSAYLFKRNSDVSFTELAKLTASDPASIDQFGFSVGISGDYMLISSPGNDDAGSGSGSAYVFKRNSDVNITEIAKLTASDGAADDAFGISVSINGDDMLIGAFTDDAGSNSGSTYVFKRESDVNITELTKLTASDGAANGGFGRSLSINGDFIIIGAFAPDISGVAYLFKRNGGESFTELAKLRASDTAAGDFFGNSVAISGDHIVIGTSEDDDDGASSGSISMFSKDLEEGLFILNPVNDISFDESLNNTFVSTFHTASYEDGVVSLSVEGTDSTELSFTNDKDLSFIIQPSVAAPTDANVDNVYEIEVVATDSERNSVRRDITVTVE